MPAGGGGCPARAGSAPGVHERHRPEQTILYRIVQQHLETYLCWRAKAIGMACGAGLCREGLQRYLECGILAYGFARAYCAECGRDFLVAFSCKGRGVCPSCNARRMAETAAHLVDHVFPPLPVRQWVFS